MKGFALVHVEPHHFKMFGDKLTKLRNVNLGWFDRKITDVRSIQRVYSGRGGYEFHIIVCVEATDLTALREIFATLEEAGCHIDGYGG